VRHRDLIKQTVDAYSQGFSGARKPREFG